MQLYKKIWFAAQKSTTSPAQKHMEKQIKFQRGHQQVENLKDITGKIKATL